MVDGTRKSTTSIGLLVMVLVAMLVVAGCGSGDESEAPSEVTSTAAEAPFAVSEAAVSHETTQDISVFAPEAEGSWPVVYLLHGYEGNRQDMAITATELARQGVVVFAPDWRSTQPQHHKQDVECGYRYVRSIAAEYGGDLDRPVTLVGYSLGGRFAVGLGLEEAELGPDGTYEECFTGVPRGDVVVAIASPSYEIEGGRLSGTIEEYLDRTAGKAQRNQDAHLVHVAGADDEFVEPWQAEDAAKALLAAGYNAKSVVLPGGNHSNVIFKGHVEGEPEWVNVPDDPVGQEVVQIILDAIEAADQ